MYTYRQTVARDEALPIAYREKVGRRAVGLGDLAEPDLLRLRVEGLLVHNNALLRGLGQPEFTADEIVASLLALAPRILPFADRVWQSLDEARRGGRRSLFEGAQGVMLGVDHGTSPYLPSSTQHGRESVRDRG